jgi:hypothetical protein
MVLSLLRYSLLNRLTSSLLGSVIATMDRSSGGMQMSCNDSIWNRNVQYLQELTSLARTGTRRLRCGNARFVYEQHPQDLRQHERVPVAPTRQCKS